MTEDILIDVTPQETRVAIVVQGIPQELHVERTSSRGLVGNICLGRIVRVLPGMQSAFIDVGLERAAFLHVADIWRQEPRRDSPARPDGVPDERSSAQSLTSRSQIGHHEPIEKLIHEGQSLLVQIVKEPLGSKGARLSTQMSIAGRLLVYLPQEPNARHVGVSQRIDEQDRDRLRTRVLDLLPASEQGGYIVRTLAEDATDEELSADIAYLRKLWDDLLVASRSAHAPSLLYQDLGLAARMLRDYAGENTASIQVDSRESYQELIDFSRAYTPNVAARIVHYLGERPLFERYGIDAEIQRALARRVDLKSGGYLIIDQTEAMTTIDVNTGGFVGGRSFDDTIFKTNLEASQAIARQLRLRNLGGIIILDFIDMENADHQNAVLTELQRALAGDRMKITVNGFTQLGLVEMTRKRTRESLAHVLCEPCPTCAATGQIKTAQTTCYEIFRELLREARQFNPREFRVLASQAVIDLFLEEESQSLAHLGDFIGKPIALQVESTYLQEQYDIVLM